MVSSWIRNFIRLKWHQRTARRTKCSEPAPVPRTNSIPGVVSDQADLTHGLHKKWEEGLVLIMMC